MADFPALPLFTDAWVADTKHLTRGERGLYMDLLIVIWRSPGCNIPDDPAWLVRHMSLTPEELIALKSLIFEFCHSDASGMCQCNGTRIFQKRLHKEWTYLTRQSDRQRKNAKSRWNKETPPLSGICHNINSGICPPPHPTPPLEETISLRSIVSAQTSPKTVNGVNGHDTARGTRLPADWFPSADDLAFAAEQGLDGRTVADAFRDYWHATPGAKGRKLNWSATFRNWCRREAKPAGKVQRNGPATGIARGFAEAIRQLDEEDANRGRDFPPDVPLLGRH